MDNTTTPSSPPPVFASRARRASAASPRPAAIPRRPTTPAMSLRLRPPHGWRRHPACENANPPTRPPLRNPCVHPNPPGRFPCPPWFNTPSAHEPPYLAASHQITHFDTLPTRYEGAPHVTVHHCQERWRLQDHGKPGRRFPLPTSTPLAPTPSLRVWTRLRRDIGGKNYLPAGKILS